MINSRNLDDLQPQVAWRMREFLRDVEMRFGVAMLVTSTLRDNESQDELYSKGRRGVVGEKIVTNAKGGDSIHNYACAIDAVPMRAGKPQWDDTELLEAIGRRAMSLGLVWGGDWNANGIKDKLDWDLVHFQWTGGLTLAQLKAGAELPKE